MRRFDAHTDDPLDGESLWEKVVRLPPACPQAYLMCSHTATGTRIYCLHTPTQYPEALDGSVTPWDQLGFAFLGDVFQGSITTVFFPKRVFDILEPVAARVAQRLTADLNQLRGATVLEPLDDDDLATTLVITRRFMPLPFRYVSRFLDAKGYTVAEAWHLVVEGLSEEESLAECQPLLDWLRVSAQASVGENGRLQTPLTSTALQAPLADQDLQQHILSTLHCALPQLRSVSSASDISSAILTLATNVAENTMLTNQGKEERQHATTALKLPSHRFKTTLPLLLNTLLVEDEDDLPPLWHQLANADKKQDFLII
jgi:hypothetical protein